MGRSGILYSEHFSTPTGPTKESTIPATNASTIRNRKGAVAKEPRCFDPLPGRKIGTRRHSCLRPRAPGILTSDGFRVSLSGRIRRASGMALHKSAAPGMSPYGTFVEIFLQALLAGILIGAIYGLMCVGLGIIFGAMRVINFAQGEFLMLGMYAAFFLTTGYGVLAFLGPYAGPVVAAFVAGPL